MTRACVATRRRCLPHGSYAEQSAETSCGVVGLCSVVIDEHLSIASIAEKGTAKFADIPRRCNPTGSPGIELAELLQHALLFFRK